MSGKETGYLYTKLVAVRGDSRTSGDSTTDFTINLGNNMQRISRVSVPSILFRNNAYNVNSSGGGANNTFGLTIGMAEGEFSVDAGWYTTVTLMTAVEDAINAFFALLGDGQSIALTQDSLTSLVTITYTAGTGVSSIDLIDTEVGPGVWELLGFVPTVVVTTTATATNYPSLGGLTEVFLRSNALAPGNLIGKDGKQQNVLLAVPVIAEYGKLNMFECKEDSLCEISYLTPRNISEVDFSLTDKAGNVVDLHGANLIINLKVWFNRF